ncbi:Cell division protein ZapA [Candidatus Entotheonellaceae bacterium PAL068K]
MAEATNVEIEIFGQTFWVAAGDATPAHIQRLAGYVDERMRVIAQTAKTMPLTRVAILTALNIADDLIKLQDHYEHTSHLLDTKTDQLIALVQEQFVDP